MRISKKSTELKYISGISQAYTSAALPADKKRQGGQLITLCREVGDEACG